MDRGELSAFPALKVSSLLLGLGTAREAEPPVFPKNSTLSPYGSLIPALPPTFSFPESQGGAEVSSPGWAPSPGTAPAPSPFPYPGDTEPERKMRRRRLGLQREPGRWRCGQRGRHGEQGSPGFWGFIPPPKPGERDAADEGTPGGQPFPGIP